MSAPASASEVQLVGAEPPPIRRDPVTWCWVIFATVSGFGDSVFSVALAWTAVRELHPGMAGLVVAIGMVPQALLMLFGGVIADRLDTRRIMIIGEFFRAAVLLGAAICWQAGLHTATLLIMVELLFGIAVGLSAPARSTLVRQLVRPDDLVEVSGWMQIGGRLAVLGGAPAGAIVVATAGLTMAMLIDAGTFLLIALVLIVVIRFRYRLPRQRQGSAWSNLRDGFSHLARHRRQRTLTLGICSLNVFITPVTAIGVSLRVSHSGWSATWVGVSEASLAIGAIVGSMIAIRWRGTHLARRGFWVLVLQGAGLTLVGVPALPSLVGGMILVGLTAGLASVWISGVFQREISPDYLGRVSSLTRLGDLAITPMMTPLFGLVAGASSVLAATVACGAAMSLLCLIVATRREIRTLE
ncbi:MFS transporter [Microlunatus elymi]|nr:MFS transporter [Microlunatus elymi]